jgi:NAD(P)-dependent dehydrogenase (short-subunit alcohol dehydrogenase family)
MNINDNARSFNAQMHRRVYDANVVYILESLKVLLDENLLSAHARLLVISSVWQNIARSNKLSYGVTKSALLGLVQSTSLDLGAEGKLINAVLPGALDTPMTRANLSSDQIGRLEAMTPLGTLPALSDVCNLAGFLCSPENTGITGQFIAADRGFSNAKIV